MLIDAAWFLLGLTALVFGAEIMVRGGAEVAARLGISPIVIGLTVVSIGTSLPELAVGVVAVQDGSAALAVGNIAGTNVVNLLLILGLSALLVPLAIQMRTLRFELPVIAGAALLMFALALDGTLSQVDGIILVTGAVVYTVVLIRMTRRESRDVLVEYDETYAEENIGSRSTRWYVLMMVAGIVVVVIGADWLVDGAVGIARGFGVSDALIGLTVVAIGTSAPELVTTVVSTVRGDRDIAVGNLLGSSIYNILLILGVTTVVSPLPLPIGHGLAFIDIPVMTAVTLLCLPVFLIRLRISRFEGGLFVLLYLAYLTYLISART